MIPTPVLKQGNLLKHPNNGNAITGIISGECVTSSITIRNLDDKLKASLPLRTARHGLSMKQEVRNSLQNTLVTDTNPANGLEFALRINQRFKGLGADDLALPERLPARPVPNFDPA